jgi:hypothetical protein
MELTREAYASAEVLPRRPITGFFGFWANAASGHVIAGTNTALMKSRRRTRMPLWLQSDDVFQILANWDHVRFGSLADILRCGSHVRFTPNSGHEMATVDVKSNLGQASQIDDDVADWL